MWERAVQWDDAFNQNLLVGIILCLRYTQSFTHRAIESLQICKWKKILYDFMCKRIIHIHAHACILGYNWTYEHNMTRIGAHIGWNRYLSRFEIVPMHTCISVDAFGKQIDKSHTHGERDRTHSIYLHAVVMLVLSDVRLSSDIATLRSIESLFVGACACVCVALCCCWFSFSSNIPSFSSMVFVDFLCLFLLLLFFCF